MSLRILHLIGLPFALLRHARSTRDCVSLSDSAIVILYYLKEYLKERERERGGGSVWGLNSLHVSPIMVKMARVRTKQWTIGAGVAGGWNIKHLSMVWDEDVYLIGASCGACISNVNGYEARICKGVGDPSVDVYTEDTYFHISAMIGGSAAAGNGGSQASSVMLPHGYFFPVQEDEPVFIDVFAQTALDGGSIVLYYVLKRDWKK
jgi:hypothetical protein